MGILKREAQRALEKQGKGGGSAPSAGGPHNPLAILAIILLFVLAFPLLGLFGTPTSLQLVLPQVDYDARATSLEQQQQITIGQMTQVAERNLSGTAQAQQATQSQQNNLNTQIAAATAAEAVKATATSWSLTQTPLAYDEQLRQLRLQKIRREAYWSQFMAPLKVIGGDLLVAGILVLLVIGMVLAFARLLPVVVAKLRVVKEDARERTIVVHEDGSIIRPDLMDQPQLTKQVDGSMQPSGGADTPEARREIAQLAARVKAVQALPPGVKIPGNVPVTNVDQKIMPDLEWVDGEIVKPQLLKDVRQSLAENDEV